MSNPAELIAADSSSGESSTPSGESSTPSGESSTPSDASSLSRDPELGTKTSWASLLTRLILAVIVIAILYSAGKSFLAPLFVAKEERTLITHSVKRSDLLITITEKGTLESSDNTEIKNKARGENVVIWVIENGSVVEEGDELVRLDTLEIEDKINERSKYAHWSRSGAESAQANASRAKLAINQYLEGTFVSQLKSMEKDLAIAQSNLRTAQNMLDHAKSMYERGYVSGLEVEEREFAVTQAKLNVEVQETQIEVLENFTKAEQLERLKGDLKAAEANRDSLVSRAKMDGTRRDLAVQEMEKCVIKAPKAGMVIYPSQQKWDNTPDVEEGATVHREQILLLMPDLNNMQVKVGVHESIVERVKAGQKAVVTLPERQLPGEVSEVASVAEPAGWWTGNVVKYDTLISLPKTDNLRPGMSAEVEITLAEYEDVLTVPVVGVIETEDGSLCWVQTESGIERRVVELGDSNDVFIVVNQGLEEGEEVVLNPRAFIEEAKNAVLKQTTSMNSDPDTKSAKATSPDVNPENQKNGNKESSIESEASPGKVSSKKKQESKAPIEPTNRANDTTSTGPEPESKTLEDTQKNSVESPPNPRTSVKSRMKERTEVEPKN